MTLDKKIIFSPLTDEIRQNVEYPKPSKLCVPDWYKKIPKYKPGFESNILIHDYDDFKKVSQATNIKSCIPFLDAITSGYMLTLPADVQIQNNNNNIDVLWLVPSAHPFFTLQFENEIIGFPKTSNNTLLKYMSGFHIKTPKGYSCLFVTPFNRNDLPFKVVTGIVDTDQYTMTINFPMEILIKDQETIFLEKGTPIVQIIPFKRDSWSMEIDKKNHDSLKGAWQLLSKIQNSYKKQFWSRKIYN